MQSDYDAVCVQIGKPLTILPRLNVGCREDFRQYFADPIDRDLFLRHYYRDFEQFGYSADL